MSGYISFSDLRMLEHYISCMQSSGLFRKVG